MQLDNDFWVLLGHFVEQAVAGNSLSFAAAENLTKDLRLPAPEELLATYIALPEPSWDHPVYAVERRSRDCFPLNVVQPWTVGPAVCVGNPGREVAPAFALLLLRSWRNLQRPPDIHPCPKPLVQVKAFVAKIIERADAWRLNILPVDGDAIREWLEACESAHRETQRREYLGTPLDEAKKAEFIRSARSGFRELLTFSREMLAFIASGANTGAPLKWFAVQMPRSFLFRELAPPDLNRVGRDVGISIATTLEQNVLLKWAETAEAQGPHPLALEEALRDGAEWLITTQKCDSGLIALMGHYDVREAACRVDGFSPPTMPTQGRQHFIGTFRGHYLVWLRTGHDNATRKAYAFDLCAVGRAESQELTTYVVPDVVPRLEFIEGAEIARRSQTEGRQVSENELSAFEEQIYVEADLGRLPIPNPTARYWNLMNP